MNKGTDKPVSLDDIYSEAIKIPKTNFVTKEKVTIPDNQVVDIIQRIASHFNFTAGEAFSAVAILMLKGASNANAPGSMAIEMITKDGKQLTIQKHDIITIYRRVTGNEHIRRLAETLGPKICEYALANELDGDLAKSFNTKEIAKGNSALTTIERAWANSFVQDNPKVAEAAPRISQLLVADYASRFPRRASTTKKKTNSIPPRPEGSKPQKPKKVSKK